MLSRNRSICGVKPYVRATCNPDVDSWVADFISWWIDQETGYLANLHGLSLVERERLLNGNWKIRPAAGLYFKPDQTRIVSQCRKSLLQL